MAQDAKSEFERIFGKTQKGNEAKPSEGNSTPGMTQKLPSDSDLLGIRTDSDRFLVKNLPESAPGEPDAPSSSNPQQKSPPEPHAQDAMTIALNVNVFANIADAKSQIDIGSSAREKDKQQVSGTLSEILGNKPGDIRGHSADGPTFVIPLSKDSAKPADTSKQAAGASPRSSVADEFARILKPKAAPSNSSPNTEFTRVLHIEDKVKVPKPNFPPSLDDSPPASTIAVTSDPKLPAESREPTVVTRPGPSDFTKVVKGSELRTLQEKLATAASHQNAPTPASWQPPAPYPASGSSTQPWQSAPPAPVPQYIPASGTSWPGSGQSPAMPAPSGIPQPSKLSQYMPLIIALNLLVLIAILLIVFFAIKK